MIRIAKFEDINIPIKVGDTILGGRFKNKKTVVKKIGKNAKGDITVNWKPLLKYRLLKENDEISFAEDTKDMLKPIEDIGLKVKITDDVPYSSSCDWNNETLFIEIYKANSGDEDYSFDCKEFSWNDIAPDIQTYISYSSEEYNCSLVAYYIKSNDRDGFGWKRSVITKEDILNESDFGNIKKFIIDIKKPVKK